MSDEIEYAVGGGDPEAITALYTAVGWNRSGARTVEKTRAVLAASATHVVARVAGRVVGFGRVIGDAYAAQLLDIITHPDYRRRGIATEITRRLLAHARAQALGVMLVDGTGLEGFYERLGFEAADPATDRLMYWVKERSAAAPED